MEDVIFAGTRERKPLGMAQVTLTMAQPQNGLHATEALIANGCEHPSEVTARWQRWRACGESPIPRRHFAESAGSPWVA